MPNVAEIRGMKDVLVDALSGGVATVAEMHAAIARYPFAILERIPTTRLPAAAVRVVHDQIAASVYGTLRGVTAGAGLAADVALVPLRHGVGPQDRPVWLDLALGALNGVLGDRLEERGNALRMPMELCHAGRALALDADALRRSFPGATGRLAVFVHGLAGHDLVWRLYAQEHWGDPETTYGSLLARDLGYTPLYLRYNSGLHVSENGARLAERLEALVRAWPVAVDEIVLVGHSMGGLVARSACHQDAQNDRAWIRAVHHVVCLGSPHLGAPLEKLGNLAS